MAIFYHESPGKGWGDGGLRSERFMRRGLPNLKGAFENILR